MIDTLLNTWDDLRRILAVLLMWAASEVMPTAAPGDVAAMKHLTHAVRVFTHD